MCSFPVLVESFLKMFRHFMTMEHQRSFKMKAFFWAFKSLHSHVKISSKVPWTLSSWTESCTSILVQKMTNMYKKQMTWLRTARNMGYSLRIQPPLFDPSCLPAIDVLSRGTPIKPMTTGLIIQTLIYTMYVMEFLSLAQMSLLAKRP